MAYTQEDVNNWFAANPNASTAQVAQTVQGLGGLSANPELTGLLAQHYGTDAATINTGYNTLTNTTPAGPSSVADLYSSVLGRAPDAGGLQYWQQQFGDTIDPNEIAAFKNAAAPELAQTHYTPTTDVNPGYTDPTGISGLYQTYLGRTPESQEVINQWSNAFGPTVDPEEVALFRQAAAPELKTTGYLSDPFKNEVKDYVASVMADNSLGDWEKTNKIMEQAQKSGVTQAQLESIYGKDVVAPYLETYKTGINDYINKALATDPTKTTFDEVGRIHQAATKYGLTPDEIAKYAGMDLKQAQSYFDMYNQGLGTVMARLNDPKVDDLTKTQTALALQQKYGATDEELAKASGGKYTTADVKAYLEPVRNVPTNLQKLFEDPNATAADIQKFLAEAKADPRAAGIYGAALDKVAANQPGLLLRDAANGNNASESYQKFLAAAKATPELATQYAPQIAAVEKALSVTARARDKDFGGKVPDYAMEMFLGLDKKTQANAPKELTANSKGAQPIYADEESGIVTGYTKKVDSDAFKDLYAKYDANGQLLGYEAPQSRVHISDPQYYYAKFDANGVPTPGTGANRSGGFLKSTLQDVASMGPIGTIALMAATGGLGGLAAGALEASLGSMAANAVGSGLASGLISEVAGGDFGKGFVGGGVGNLAGNFVGANMPTNVTGNAFVDSYLTKAAPNLAASTASAAVTGRDVGDAGVASLFNTGLNMGTNSLINAALPDTLTPAQQQWASGIGSGLIKSAITGQPIDVSKSIQNAAIQQALQTGRKG